MKKLFACLLLAVLILPLKAQNPVIEESFENWPPEGWTFHSDFGPGEWTQSDLTEEDAPEKAVDGTHTAKFFHSYFVKHNMTSPAFDLSGLQNPELSFSWYHQVENGEDDKSRLEIYVSYDGEDFELLETLPTNVNRTEWQAYSRILDKNVKKVRLRGIKDQYWFLHGLYLDMFAVKEGPACPYPAELKHKPLPGEDGKVLFSWNTEDNGNKWNVKVSTREIDPGTEEADAATKTAEGTPQCEITGLEVGKTYYWYVQTDCGTEKSKWVAGKPFLLNPAPLQIPFSIDFEEDNEGFVSIQEDQANTWNWGTAPYGADTNRCLYISEDEGVSYRYNDIPSRSYIYRDILFPEEAPNGFELVLDFRGMGNRPNHTMEVFIAEDNTYYPIAGEYIDFMITHQVGSYFNETENWTRMKFEIPASFAGMYTRLIFSWRNSESQESINPPAAIDNISMDYLACPLPKNPVVLKEELHAVTLNWDTNAFGTKKWEIEYGPYGFEPGNGTTVDVSQKPPFTVTGLTEETRYDFFIRALCGDAENTFVSEPSDRVHAVTRSLPKQAPYFNNFDDLVDDQYPLGWSHVSEDPDTIRNARPFLGSGNDFYAFSKPNCMMMTTDKGNTRMGLVSPEFSDLSQQDKRVRFYARIAFPVTLQVGVMKNPEDLESIIVLKEIRGWDYGDADGSFGMFRHTVDITGNQITDEYKHIVIRVKDSDPFEVASIDDFSYEPIPSCIEPHNLYHVDLDEYEARIGWESQGNESQWEIIWGEDDFVPSDTSKGVITDKTVHTLTDLLPMTFYRAYVRSICSETERGPWSDAYMFRTCGFSEIPFMESFDNGSAFNLPICWRVKDENSPWALSKAYAFSPAYSITYAPGLVKVDDWLFTPSIAMEAGTSYRITFRAKKLQNRDARMSVHYGESACAEGMGGALVSVDSLSHSSYDMVRAYFTPEKDGFYHIGVHIECTISPGFSIDDFAIMEGVPTANEDYGKNAFQAYPNPASDMVFLDLGTEDRAFVSIYNMSGMPVRQIPDYESHRQIPVHDLAPGSYVFRIQGEKTLRTIKVIIR